MRKNHVAVAGWLLCGEGQTARRTAAPQGAIMNTSWGEATQSRRQDFGGKQDSDQRREAELCKRHGSTKVLERVAAMLRIERTIFIAVIGVVMVSLASGVVFGARSITATMVSLVPCGFLVVAVCIVVMIVVVVQSGRRRSELGEGSDPAAAMRVIGAVAKVVQRR